MPPLSDAEWHALTMASQRFEADIRWRWKFARVDRVQDASGRPTSTRGGFSGVSRVVSVDGRAFMLKAWPAMSLIDRALGNLCERFAAPGDRHIDLSPAARVRHERARRLTLHRRGVLVPLAFAVGEPGVLVMEYFSDFRSLHHVRADPDLDLDQTLGALRAVADALALMHAAGGYHSEPGAGNILLRRDDVDRWTVAFTDFEWRFSPGVPLRERQAFDLRYFALQQAARMSRQARQAAADLGAPLRRRRETEARIAHLVLSTIYAHYRARRPLPPIAPTRLTPLMEALGYMGTSVPHHRRLLRLNARLLRDLLD